MNIYKCWVFILTLFTIQFLRADNPENNFHQQRFSDFICLIPFEDDCIERVEREKVYLKEKHLYSSNNLIYLSTSSFGELIIKNTSRDHKGSFLPKIEVLLMNKQLHESDVTHPCGFSPEVEQHLSDAAKHALEASAGMIGAAGLAVSGQPIAGGIVAAAAGICVGEIIEDIREAYNSYNDDGRSAEAKDSNERGGTDTFDAASGR